MTVSDLIKGVVVIWIAGGIWTIFDYSHWSHFYITVAGTIVFLSIYAMNRTSRARKPPSSE